MTSLSLSIRLWDSLVGSILRTNSLLSHESSFSNDDVVDTPLWTTTNYTFQLRRAVVKRRNVSRAGKSMPRESFTIAHNQMIRFHINWFCLLLLRTQNESRTDKPELVFITKAADKTALLKIYLTTWVEMGFFFGSNHLAWKLHRAILGIFTRQSLIIKVSRSY